MPDSPACPQKLTPSWRSAWALLGRDPFVLAMFFCLLLVGGDRVALRADTLTLRIVFPLLMIAGAVLYLQIGGRIKIDRILCWLFFALTLAAAISIYGSYDPTKSIGYTIWVLFDFFVIVTLCYNLTRRSPPEDILYLWFLVYRIHVFLIFQELAEDILHHVATRPTVWFYESSYLAIFMSGYFGAALYLLLREGRKYLLDFLLSVLGMLGTTAATAVIGMMLAVALNFLVARQRAKLIGASAGVAVSFAGILFLFFRKTLYYQLMIGFLLTKNFSIGDILARSGNRYVRTMIGWSAFIHHPWTGVGIGAGSTYMAVEPFPESAMRYIQKWMYLEKGQPFCNIIVEVLGTMGIVGFIPFAAIITYAIWSMTKMARNRRLFDPSAMALFIAFFSIFLSLQLEGTFLRYYLWTPLGLALGIMARRSTMGNVPAVDRGDELA